MVFSVILQTNVLLIKTVDNLLIMLISPDFFDKITHFAVENPVDNVNNYC